MQPLADAFLAGLRSCLGEKLLGVYLYGSLTFPDSAGFRQDLDYHVIVHGALNAGGREALAAMHRMLEGEFPGRETDGYYIAVGDMRDAVAPRTQMWPLWRLPNDVSWALHCAHIRAGQCIVLHGPDPSSLYPLPAWPALEAALYAEIRYVVEALDESPAFCVLNACRLLCSFSTRQVVISKAAAAEWALTHLPSHRHAPIKAAVRTYRLVATEEDARFLQEQAKEFVGAMWTEIARLEGQ